MASSTGGANLVRYFFYERSGFTSVAKQSLVALAYATARDLQIAPSAVLIRSSLHNTTSAGGKHVIDPKGWHVTIAFKTPDQAAREVHVASHGYTASKNSYTFVEGTHTPEKPDSFPRGGKNSGKVVWPSEESLVEYVDSPIAYSHLPE